MHVYMVQCVWDTDQVKFTICMDTDTNVCVYIYIYMFVFWLQIIEGILFV